MTTWRDLLIRFLLLVVVYELVINLYRISFLTDNFIPHLAVVIVLVISYFLIIKNLKDRKRVSGLIKNDLAALNYNILSERPLTLQERYENFEFKVGLNAFGIPLEIFKYKAEIKRHFVVRNEKDHDFELIITVIQTWRNKFKFRIESTSRIRN